MDEIIIGKSGNLRKVKVFPFRASLRYQSQKYPEIHSMVTDAVKPCIDMILHICSFGEIQLNELTEEQYGIALQKLIEMNEKDDGKPDYALMSKILSLAAIAQLEGMNPAFLEDAKTSGTC